MSDKQEKIQQPSGIPKPASSTATSEHQQSVPKTSVPIPRQQSNLRRKAGTESSQAPSAPSNWAQLEANYKQDIENLTESAEMATIEKEIAEEKLDNCERELEELKDKLAEAKSQIETLTKEQSSIGTGNNESTVTVLQLQKVEEQNELLKQALIKLRDISTKDKKSLEDLQIEHEELQEKLLDLEEKEQKYLEQIKIFEEQIDVSQSAQEMVEKLTQQKTELEDKLRDVLEDLDSMEKLRDLNEQLLENARETEIELTSELDKMRVQYSELNNRKRDMEDYLSDQERTVSKLKEENRILNDQIISLRDQFKEGESIEQQKHQIENVAYKLNFSESRMAEKEAELVRYKRNLSELEEQMSSLSLITKEQSTRLDELKLKLETKVCENSELQRALKKKMDEVSELEIRRDMAEKKLQNVLKDSETKITNLNRQIETLKGIEIQHEEDMKRLMEDNEIIERERRDLRDQLNKSNRSLERSMQTANMTMCTAQDTSLASLGISFQTIPSNQASPMHHHHQQQQSMIHNQSIISQQQSQTPQAASLTSTTGHGRNVSLSSDASDSIFLGKIKDLSSAFDQINKRNYELEVELAMKELDSKIPPYSGTSISNNLRTYYDIDRAKTLRSEVQKLKREIRAAMINQQIYTKTKHIVSQSRNEKFNNSKLAVKYQILENEASSILSTSTLKTQFRPKQQLTPLLQSTPVK